MENTNLSKENGNERHHPRNDEHRVDGHQRRSDQEHDASCGRDRDHRWRSLPGAPWLQGTDQACSSQGTEEEQVNYQRRVQQHGFSFLILYTRRVTCLKEFQNLNRRLITLSVYWRRCGKKLEKLMVF